MGCVPHGDNKSTPASCSHDARRVISNQPMVLKKNCTWQAPDVPLDVLGAESEGQIGYLLETALAEALPEAEVALYLSVWCPFTRAKSEAAHESPHACPAFMTVSV